MRVEGTPVAFFQGMDPKDDTPSDNDTSITLPAAILSIVALLAGLLLFKLANP